LKLQVSVSDLPYSRKSLTLEIASDDVKAEFDKVYEAYSRQAKVPGFRPGRVPRGVIQQRFSKEVQDQVVGNLLPHALEHAINDYQLKIVGKAAIDDILFNESKTMVIKASIDVLPEFELKEYKGMRLTKRIGVVRDKDVEKVIENARLSAAEFVPVEDRPSRMGDFVSVNLTGKYVEPQEDEDLKPEEAQVELGGSGVLKEFNENLLGVKAGDVRDFRIAYPEDFTRQALAGKTIDLTAEVVAVRKKELPELDDEFAKEFGDSQSLKEMRTKVRAILSRQAQDEAETRLHNSMIRRLIRIHDFQVPLTLVETYANQLLEDYAQRMYLSGVSPQIARQMDWSGIRKDAMAKAYQQLQADFIISRIAEAEDVKVDEEEIGAEIERAAAMRGETVEQLKARLTKDEGLSSIKTTLRHQKAFDLVLSHSEVTVEEFTGELPDDEIEGAAELATADSGIAVENQSENRPVI
jgi:trigger factor